MARTKQALKGRAKTHKKQVLRLRLRKNKFKGAKRKAAGRSRKKSGARTKSGIHKKRK
jgi:hypothetical protein